MQRQNKEAYTVILICPEACSRKGLNTRIPLKLDSKMRNACNASTAYKWTRKLNGGIEAGTN